MTDSSGESPQHGFCIAAKVIGRSSDARTEKLSQDLLELWFHGSRDLWMKENSCYFTNAVVRVSGSKTRNIENYVVGTMGNFKNEYGSGISGEVPVRGP